MLNKISVPDKIEVLENGVVQVRTAIRIMEGSSILGQSFHRHCIVPGQDYSQEDAKVMAVCATVHTPECIAAYEAAAAQQGA